VGTGYPTPRIPALFQAYLTLGARVLGPPAVDRAFKTIDWLALLDTRELDPITHRTFFR
jgi:putative hemolysin